MKRELKFRAWHNEHHQMYWFDLMWGNHKEGNGYIGMVEWGYERGSERNHNANQSLIDPNNCEIMQYTGLKDKNGKEIFEGDIVRILYTDWISKSDSDPRTLDQYLTDIAKIQIVIWDTNGFYVSSKVGGYSSSMEPGKYGYIEIIGNIHQNPELC